MHVFAAITNVLMGAPNVLSICLACKTTARRKKLMNQGSNGGEGGEHATQKRA